jgi:CBS-domain-containing membrane protein
VKTTVQDLMTRTVVVVKQDAPFKEIVRLMDEHRVSALPVLDDEGVLVGIVSEADLLLKEEPEPGDEHPFARRRRRRELAKSQGLTARQVMTSPVVSVAPELTVGRAARVMHKKGVKRLPVTDPEGRVVGIVSRADLLRLFLRPDDEIEREVREDVLGRLMMIEHGTVHVVVGEGVVLLRGQVERRSLVDTIVEVVRGVDGVVGVESDLTFDVDDLAARPQMLTPWGISADSLRP